MIKLNGNRANWLLFSAFAIILFLKNILFHWDAFHTILISSLWHNPLSFYKFYMAKLLMPLFVASFLFISKHRWWTIVVTVLIDLWATANLIYFKTYDAFLSINDLFLINNMDGAWSSITVYFDKYIICSVLLTIVWCIVYICSRKIKTNRQWVVFVSSILIIIILTFVNNYFTYNGKFWMSSDPEEAAKYVEEADEWIEFVNSHGGHVQNSVIVYAPFYNSMFDPDSDLNMFFKLYVRDQSISSYFIAANVYFFANISSKVQYISLSDDDLQSIAPYVYKADSAQCPYNNLIVLLVESLEDWPLHHPIEDQEIAPYLTKLKEQNHVFYCDKISSQTLGGNSGDGQMIINSGLLPIQNGVACETYGNNVYPNFAHFYTNSVLVNPWPKIWNQDTMSLRYGYTQKLEPHQGEEWEDAELMDVAMDYLRTTQEPACVFVITVSTHVPFNRVRNEKIHTTAPSILNRYMKCLNYTDSCIAGFMETVLGDPKLSQSTVVITGDHTIFKPSMLPDFRDYAQSQNLSIANGENYCPLIIYSPKIQGNIHVDEVCYQMDVFPTILNLIGCENYYWKGLGVNLLDSTARHNRPITEQDAYILSDKIISGNYFATWK